MPRTATHFGRTLRAARRAADKTLGDVADLIGVTAAHLSDVERGNRKPLAPNDIETIARWLGADFNILLTAAARDRKEFRISTEHFTGKQMEYGLVLLRGLHELSEDEIAAHVTAINEQLKAKRG